MAKTYEAMQRTGGLSSSGWHFLDLKSRKQSGDVEKKILQYKQKNNFKIFNFSSAKRKEGVSTILANLVNYYKFQNPDKRILVIDANFDAPALHQIFNIGETPHGLNDVLEKKIPVDNAAVPLGSTNISVLTATDKTSDLQSDHLDQEKLIHFLNENKDHYDFIFIDSPPILASSDSLSTAIASDITFWIIKSMAVQKDVARKARRLLLDNECIIGGVILNQVRQVIPEWVYRLT